MKNIILAIGLSVIIGLGFYLYKFSEHKGGDTHSHEGGDPHSH